MCWVVNSGLDWPVTEGTQFRKNGLSGKAIICHLLAGFKLLVNSFWSLNLALITVTLKSKISVLSILTSLFPFGLVLFHCPRVSFMSTPIPRYLSMKKALASAMLNPKGLCANGGIPA